MVSKQVGQGFLYEINPFQKQKNVQLLHNLLTNTVVFLNYLPIGSDPHYA